MAYIIENANILKKNHLTQCSLLIRENQIAALQAKFNRYKLIKMNAEAYIMTPSYVLFNTSIPLKSSFKEIKTYMIEQFIMKGCTTLFTYVQVSFENELIGKMKEIKTALISSPIDFLIGVKIPLRLLSPTFIRICKKEKIPAIFLEINNPEELSEIPWGWIKEALFPYNNLVIPLLSDLLKQEAKMVLSKWKGTMETEKITALFEELVENEPLTIPTLNKLGLFPKKASLMHGAELSYNLYIRGREVKNLDEVSLFHYHRDRLAVTVHKGQVIRSGKEVLYKPGNGEYIEIRTPSYFSI